MRTPGIPTILVRCSAAIAPLLLAVVLGGCGESSPVAPIADVPQPLTRDAAPPAVPTGLAARVDGSDVKLGWQPNVTDPDHAGFVLTRTAAGASVSLIATPQRVTTFVDTHPFAGLAVYELRSVNLAGNASAAAVFVVAYDADQAAHTVSMASVSR